MFTPILAISYPTIADSKHDMRSHARCQQSYSRAAENVARLNEGWRAGLGCFVNIVNDRGATRLPAPLPDL